MDKLARGGVALFLSFGMSAAVAADSVPAEAPSDAAAPPAKAAPANRFVEEVIVTAQKREENLQDVPISIQAFSAEALDARGITNPIDLPLATPGLTFNSVASYSIIFLRGIGTDAFIPSADNSVASYVDGVYFPSSFGTAQEFGGLERLEVLKGPQGTLFGRNTTGGAISVVTKKPGRDFETDVETSFASYGTSKTRVYTNVPLSDTWAMNVSALYTRVGQYYDSDTVEIEDDINRGARVKVRWTPNEQFDITLSGFQVQYSGTGTMIANNLSPKPLLQAVANPNASYEAKIDAPPTLYGHTAVGYTEAIWTPGPLDVKFIGSIQDINSFGRIDFDGTPIPVATFQGTTGKAKIKTAELQFLSNRDSWGSDWLTYIGGLYYITSVSGFDPVYLTVGPTQLLPAGIDDALGDLGDLLMPNNALSITLIGEVDTSSSAGFFQTTAKMTDWLSATLGGRYQTETRKLTRSKVGIDTISNPQVIVFQPQRAETTNFSPKVSLDFRPMDDVLIYASYTKGFKSGTYNIINLYTPPDYVKPEKVAAIELGIKTQLFDGALRFNTAAFESKIDDLQVQIISLQSGGAVSFENAGSARIRGFEFDTVWMPLPDALPGLVFSGGATFLDAEYTKFPTGSGYDEITGLYFGDSSVLPGRDFAGNQIARAPDLTTVSSLSYTFDFDAGSLEVAADYYYNSGYFFSSQNSKRSEQPSYDVVNARISYFYAPWRLRTTVFGRNITDTKYYLYQFESDFGTASMLQSPSVYGIRFNWEF